MKSTGWRKAVREFLYGMFLHEHVEQARDARASLESLFLVVVFGDMVGLPVLPPYYALRLLPFTLGLPAGLEAPDAPRARPRRRARAPPPRHLTAAAGRI